MVGGHGAEGQDDQLGGVLVGNKFWYARQNNKTLVTGNREETNRDIEESQNIVKHNIISQNVQYNVSTLSLSYNIHLLNKSVKTITTYPLRINRKTRVAGNLELIESSHKVIVNNERKIHKCE